MSKFKIKDIPYTRTVVSQEGDKKVAENQEFNILESIQALKAQDNFNFQRIPLEKIEINPLNKEYREITTEEEIRALADSIAAYGMAHNLQLKVSLNPGMYMLIAGEKRVKALKLLKSEGNDVYPEGVPSNLMSGDMDEVDEEILIHTTNILSRNYQAGKFIILVERFEALLKMSAQKNGLKVRNINGLIANLSGMSERMVRRYRAINDNLVPELIKALAEKKIGQRDADSYIQLSEKDQAIVVEYLNAGRKISADEVIAIREEEMEKFNSSIHPKYNQDENIDSGSVTSIPLEEGSEIPITDFKEEKESYKDVREAAIKKAIEKREERPKVTSVAADIEAPGVKRRVLERDIEKLSKMLRKSIEQYSYKEKEYRAEYGTFSPQYDNLKNIINEIFTGGEV